MDIQENNPASSPAPPSLPAMIPAVFPPSMPASQARPCEEDKSLAMLCHLLAIFTGFIGPLILWLVKKDSSAFVAHHGREALNFQLTLLIVMMCLASATFVLMFVFIGILLFPVLFVVPILALVAEIIAAVAAQKGEWHRYPYCMRLVCWEYDLTTLDTRRRSEDEVTTRDHSLIFRDCELPPSVGIAAKAISQRPMNVSSTRLGSRFGE